MMIKEVGDVKRSLITILLLFLLAVLIPTLAEGGYYGGGEGSA